MKDVKKLLSKHKSEVLPDDRVREEVKHALGLDAQRERVAARAQGGERTMPDGKKTAIAVLAVLLIAGVFLAVFLPLSLGRGDGGGMPDLPPIGDAENDHFQSITDADSFYAFGAASVGSILSSQTAEAAGASAAAVAAAVSASDGRVEVVDRYLSLVESLLGDGGIKGESINGEGYDFGMRVVSTDLLGGTESYILYYNKEFIGGETYDDEREDNYSIYGVLIVGGERYPVVGTYKVETEEDETENELFFRAYTSADERSYIEVAQEHESETEDGESETEAEYVYTVFEDGVRIERMTVEYEEEEGELELAMTIEHRDGRVETLEFNDETDDGERVIVVRGDMGGERVSFRIYVREGKYHYVFEDGTSVDEDRHAGGRFGDAE